MKSFKKSNLTATKEFNVKMLDAQGNAIDTPHTIWASSKSDATNQAKAILKSTRGAVRHSKIK